MVDIHEGKTAIELLENWAGWLRVSTGNKSGFCSSMYMSPEEKALAGGVCREAKFNEQHGMRVEAMLAVMMQNSKQQGFVRLLKQHYHFRANPHAVCRKEGLPIESYKWHVERAVKVFENVFVENSLTATKMLRYHSLNNSIPPRREQNPSRVLLCA
ncbi:hypothetical protein R6242_14270 [Iodobacter sp. CM08]|uniref:hypothetical protein n=1 Tax=Iodobacter sp. CM08 TaxID=3085902 RepID=UPI0029825E0E|nr:hypothetical protein [Iodobacter sp. CM08]MDW5417732.1 hypothetical protein [Iodobacter sp. CM08]